MSNERVPLPYPAPQRPMSRLATDRFGAMLVVFVLLLLGALVMLPVVIGRRSTVLVDMRANVIAPAQQTLQESKALLTEQIAALRSYLITGQSAYLEQFQDALIAERPATERLVALAGRTSPAAAASARLYAEQVAQWQSAPRALLAGAVTRAQLTDSLATGQRLFETALAAAEQVRLELSREALAVQRRIDDAGRRERTLTVLLALGAFVAALIMVWLMRRLQRVSRDLAAQAETARRSEENLRLITENLREMIWITDPGYTEHYYLSPAYARIWGLSMEEARHNPRSFLAAVIPEDRPHVEDALRSYSRGEYAAEYRVAGPDGAIRWISARSYPVRDENGAIFRVVGIAEDVTALKREQENREQLLEREREARESSEAALRLRDQVVRIVSHDLKNPLHTIGMAAELLEMPLKEEQRLRQLEIIRRTVDRANRMVSDLLDAARLQAGRAIAVTLAPLDVSVLLAEVVEAFSLQAGQQSQQLSYAVAEHIAPVLGDRDRLLQALSNLVGNAVKFTPVGGRIQLAADMQEARVRIRVSDTGRGMEADVLQQIFEPFAQARDTASLGTGLGLAITRGIVEAHDGSITAESEPGAGSTFTITLPAAPTDGRRAGERRATMDRRKKADEKAVDQKKPAEAEAASANTEQPRAYPDLVDDTLDDSFPASDPPQWWHGDDDKEA